MDINKMIETQEELIGSLQAFIFQCPHPQELEILKKLENDMDLLRWLYCGVGGNRTQEGEVVPYDRSKYPKDWEQIALSVKESANWTCQNCGKPCRRPGQSWSDFVGDLLPDYEWYELTRDEDGKGGTIERPQRFTLTVAHLDHNPANCDRSNLKALCSTCHLKYDAKFHAKNASATRQRKKERVGQLTLGV